MADMASRIAMLEKSLAKMKEEGTSIPEGSLPSATTTHVAPRAQPVSIQPGNPSEREKPGEDILVQKGSSTQYFNEVLLSRVIEEEGNVRSVLTPPHITAPHPPVSSPFNALGILSSPCPSLVPANLHPPKRLAVGLWNIYVENVEVCTGLKMLHLPTDQVRVYSTIEDPGSASTENLALCFAIYFASTVSLDAPDAQITLGQDTDTLLLRFKIGLEQALAHGDFLDRPTITGLHALAIYLSVLRVHNRGKGIWILNGLAIRIAKSLGLHRDGAQLGLSVFDSEIRRRLWWHLVSRDSRAGEDYGLENTNSLLMASDVSLPINVADSELYPEMQHLPEPREGWTPMTFSLVYIALAKSMQRLATIAASSRPSSPPSEDTRARIVKETEMQVEKLLHYCNPVIPPQRLTLLCSRFLLRKLDFVTRLQWILLKRSDPDVDFATEENLQVALELLETNIYHKDPLLIQFAWVYKAYPQYHVALYILSHLSVKPEGPNVERAWEEIDKLFGYDLLDKFTSGFGSKAAVLAALRTKALAVRERVQRQNPEGDTTAKTRCWIPSMVSRASVSSSGSLPTYLPANSEGAELDLSGTEGFPDWTTLVQGFHLHGHDDFWQ
ncbi:hypothetical protein ARAM_000571 [Aspergillus rambellii]|uniref:Xylanolytic transcriptional activator regulatory domain-containing protein n=1 Tax=Aspergillus rambellii TaxID=308745 RepID=A0A0F8U0G8_9EURO|nr:hypothetical protein ARAM_000571 [Aspergillus rambellii]